MSASIEGWATVGPVKILVDEVVGLDVDLLAKHIEAHHSVGRAVAVRGVASRNRHGGDRNGTRGNDAWRPHRAWFSASDRSRFLARRGE